MAAVRTAAELLRCKIIIDQAARNGVLMSEQISWSTFHPSALRHAAVPLQWVAATARPQGGAIRYRCPISDSFVLVTDEATLSGLARPRARLRCADCGEMHLLTLDGTDVSAEALPSIVAAAAKS
jgi:hypothetical protein